MNNFIYTEAYNKIIRKLTSAKWQQELQIDHSFIDSLIRSTAFQSKFHSMILNADYSCSSTLNLVIPALEKISGQNAPADWLLYIYQYTLNKSFPEAVSIELHDSLNSCCEIYLRILRVVCEAEKCSGNDSWKSKYSMNFLTKEEEKGLEYPEEYKKFLKAYRHNYIYELMKLSEEVLNINTLDHVCGVHFLSMYIARQLKDLGIPVDLGRVSGAAAGHDIGKYGCKKSELKKVPRLHYYYTDQWFKKYSITYIRNIAINHSTWDLEFENLPIESLLLIYSDFRVKNERFQDTEKMRLFSLDESFYVILSKLENVDEAKLSRYKKVYSKLKDFQDFLMDLGVRVNITETKTAYNVKKCNYSLLQGNDIIQNLKYLSIKHNINLMHELRDEYSLGSILDAARSDSDWKNLREYIRLLEEYSTYLTQRQKLQTIRFLFENIVHPEDDIRRHCAELIGTLIAIFDENYRKEMPQDVIMEPSQVSSGSLLKEYISLMLQPKHKTIELHKFYLKYSISIMISSLFNHIDETNIPYYRNIILSFFNKNDYKNNDAFIFLLETAKQIPVIPEDENLNIMYTFILNMLGKRNTSIRISALESSCCVINKLSSDSNFSNMLKKFLYEINHKSDSPSENYLLYKLSKEHGFEERSEVFKKYCILTKNGITNIFLSNLKTATDWTQKETQIDMLYEYAVKSPQYVGLHTAIHFCNLLKVSAVESVRNRAGNAVLKIMPLLTLAERNELAIEILRALELQGNRFTEYIPYYAGQLILWLQPNELDEAIDDFAEKIKSSKSNLISLILKTIGVALENYPKYEERFDEDDDIYNGRILKMLSIILNGLGNYDTIVKQNSFSVIGKYIFASKLLTFKQKEDIFKLIAKKILTLIADNKEQELLFLTNSAGLNSIYRFISDFTFLNGDINIKSPEKVAIFPGTFDPFSLSHKEIVRNIRDMGFEVYLAVDEFSWSKKTLPSLLRKNILSMSIADEHDVYIFPWSIPINIANPDSLKSLRECFPDSKVYIAAGSDVIMNASSYKLTKSENSITTFPHIVFARGKNQKFTKALKNIDGDVTLLSLHPKYRDISSTQIRNYIDENRDIASMVDPLVQQYIYENGFYQREPQDKTLPKASSIDLQIIEDYKEDIVNELCEILPNIKAQLRRKVKEVLSKPSSYMLLLRDSGCNNEILAFSVFHWLRSDMLYSEINNSHMNEYLRDHSLGKMILIDGIYTKGNDKYKHIDQAIITETLAYCIKNDYEYAIFSSSFKELSAQSILDLLKLQGFVIMPFKGNGGGPILVVDMSTPCVLNLDIENIMKEPFRSNSAIKAVIASTRKKLQQSLTELYPGELILSFDINLLHQFMIKKICEENNVPMEPLPDKKLGNAMCVPYGDILDRYIIPNTVTKALHTEKYFKPDMTTFKIGEFPHYLDLVTQVKMLKAFNRPVILVDNILHKGYRMQALDPLFKNENLKIKKIVAGIMSGRGKDLMDMQHREVTSVYFIPRLKVWFNENALYPFIGGDALWRGIYPERNLVSSINLIMPYTSPTFVRGASKLAIFNMSQTCIENSIEILTALENEFHILNERNLSLYSLGQVFTVPRSADHGKNIEYNLDLCASQYLKNDLELLKRFENVITGL